MCTERTDAVPPRDDSLSRRGASGPRGLARYRNAAMVGAGGLACAAVGAFLGGLGGYFTVHPAAAHASGLVLLTGPGRWPAAANQVDEAVSTARGSSAVIAASFSSLSGPLTQGIAPLHWLTAGTGSPPLPPLAATLADVAGGTSASGRGDGAVGVDLVPDRVRPVHAASTDLGLGCVLGSLTTALGNVGSLPADPSGVVDTASTLR